jgi:transposase InsO family protein
MTGRPATEKETVGIMLSQKVFASAIRFKTLKAECVYQNRFINKQQAAIIIFEYIETWYNRKRLHSALGYLSPKEFEELLNKQKIAA